MMTKAATDAQKYSRKTLADFEGHLPGTSANDIQHGGSHYKDMVDTAVGRYGIGVDSARVHWISERQHYQVQSTPREERQS